jgi:uncharacterized protein (TIGR02001 family)
MNKKIIALAAIALGAISASAQEEAPAAPAISGSVGLAYDSLYVFRGWQYAESIIEPSVNIAYGDFYAGFWFALPSKNEAFFTNEMDVTLGYGKALTDKIKLDMGLTRYTYDEIPENFFDGLSNSTEFYIGAVVDAPLSPAVYLFRDIDFKTITVETRASHSFDLGDKLSLGISASTGAVFMDDDSKSNYYYFATAANLGYAFTDSSSFSFGIRYGGSDARLIYGSLKDALAGNFSKADVWYGLSFTSSF